VEKVDTKKIDLSPRDFSEYKMKNVYRIGLFIMLFLITGSLFAQQPGPQINEEPLQRPKPLVVLETNQPTVLMERIKTTIVNNGFKIDQVDMREQYLEATKLDGPESKNYDKIIVWLERDIEYPNRYLKVYFLYGRYIEMISRKLDVYRIKITPSEEEGRIGQLKQSLISIKIP
jgi:hypothetical protein